jgi:hypothetical protein
LGNSRCLPVRRPRVWFASQALGRCRGSAPGPLGVPARSWLTTVRSIPNAFPSRRLWSGRGSGALTAKARPGDRTNAAMARRKAPRVPTRDASQRFALFGAPFPSSFAMGRSAKPGRVPASRGRTRAPVGWATALPLPTCSDDGGHASLCPPYERGDDIGGGAPYTEPSIRTTPATGL